MCSDKDNSVFSFIFILTYYLFTCTGINSQWDHMRQSSHTHPVLSHYWFIVFIY